MSRAPHASTPRSPSSTLTGAGVGIDYRPVAVMPDVKVVKIGGQSIMDRGRAALFPILDEIVAARKDKHQLVAARRRRHARAPHLRDRERARAADRRPRGARQVRPAAERAHAADAARQARRHLHPARRLREAAALLPARLHPDHDAACRRSATGRSARKAAASRRTAPTPACSCRRGARREARDLHQGRGRPLQRRSEEEPAARSTSRASRRRSCSSATCPTSSSSASSSSTCRARACARSCRSSTASSRAR